MVGWCPCAAAAPKRLLEQHSASAEEPPACMGGDGGEGGSSADLTLVKPSLPRGRVSLGQEGGLPKVEPLSASDSSAEEPPACMGGDGGEDDSGAGLTPLEPSLPRERMPFGAEGGLPMVGWCPCVAAAPKRLLEQHSASAAELLACMGGGEDEGSSSADLTLVKPSLPRGRVSLGQEGGLPKVEPLSAKGSTGRACPERGSALSTDPGSVWSG